MTGGRNGVGGQADREKTEGPLVADPVLLERLGTRCIVLVGMPGAGKSTVGRRLAKRLGLPFLDADEEIERAAGMSIPEIFSSRGESEYREGERRVIARILAGPPVLSPATVAGFAELHIEQGPILHNRAVPVGIVGGIRGAYRVRNGRVRGEWSHSGAVPHEYRRDVVFALAELAMALDREWALRRERGEDLVVTIGKVSTDPEIHSITRVPGDVAFALDMRSRDKAVLDGMEAFLRAEADRIAGARGVSFMLDPFDRQVPSPMDGRLVAALEAAADGLAIPTLPMASGGGHDAQDFAEAGIPAVMIFLRNDKGSHNPDEAMEIDDFMQGTRLLANLLASVSEAEA